jgi:phage terminase large subunit-like protein
MRFTKFFSYIPTPDGQPQQLEWFQRLILLLHFAGVRHVLVLIPKNNGKTCLLAALAIFHMLTTETPRVYIGASNVKQAKTMYNEAVRIVQLRKAWRRRLVPRPGYRAIHHAGGEAKGSLEVLASDKLDKGSLQGIGPTLAIIEELHAHVNNAIYTACRGGLNKRGGQMLSISTAGSEKDSLLGRVLEKAQAMAHKLTRGCLTLVRSNDGQFAMLEWSIGEKADHTDMAVVKGANPATFVTVEGLKEIYEDPETTTADWKRYHCGLWSVPEGRWLDIEAEWDPNSDPKAKVPDGARVVLGYDHARHRDHAALELIYPDPDLDLNTEEPRGLVVPVEMWVPEEEELGVVPFWKVKQAMRDACERWTVVGIGYDKLGGFAESGEDLENEGLPMVAVSMNSSVWGPLTAEMLAAIRTGRMRNDGDPRLRAHFQSAETKDSPHGERLHGKVKGKVDGVMATGCGWEVAFNTDALTAGGSVYEEKDMVVL